MFGENSRFALALLAFTISTSSSAWAADDSREKIERGKAATAFVLYADGKASATAFCISAKGLFVTNHHVVKSLPTGGSLKLVLDPNGEKPQEFEAKVLRSDAPSDLAILQAQGDKTDYAFLPLGDDAKLYETMAVTSYGYPFGKILAGKEAKFPDITVSVGRITALRKTEGKLQRIQLDASLNPGNSGGPVCNEAGEVVALVQSGLVGTGVNFAIPVRELRLLLAKPILKFQPPAIAEAKMHDPTEFRIDIEPFQRPLENAVVELEITSDGQPPRKLSAKAIGAKEFGVTAAPIPAPDKNAPVWLKGTVSYAKGSVQGSFADQKVKVGDATTSLSEIRSIEWGSEPAVVFLDGRKVAGRLGGLEKISVELGDVQMPLELAQAKRLQFNPPVKSAPSLNYVWTVRLGNEEIGRQEGTIRVEGTVRSYAPLTATTKFVPYTGSSQKVDLPDTISNVVWAGGGRYLLLQMSKTRKVAVYDVNQAKIANYISLASDNAMITANMDKLIVVAPGENVIERWSLTTFQKETTRTLPFSGVVKTIAMGYASDGPLLILWSPTTEALSSAKYSFYDPQTFDELKIDGNRGRGASYRDAIHVRASGTGDVFGLWATSHSPQGMETLVLNGNVGKSTYQHDSVGHVVPNYDGSAILTGIGGLHTTELNQKTRTGRSVPLVPSTHNRFYVSVPEDPGANVNLGSKPFEGVKPAVFSVSGESKLVDLPDYELGKNEHGGSWRSDDFTLDKRILFVPQANQLVTVPFTNDRLMVKPFDIRAALDKGNIDYLFVTSTPPRKFRLGQKFEYRIEAATRDSNVQYELSSGPEGMSVSRAGAVSWSVPNDFKDAKVNVIVTVKAGNQSVYESFAISAAPQ